MIKPYILLTNIGAGSIGSIVEWLSEDHFMVENLDNNRSNFW